MPLSTRIGGFWAARHSFPLGIDTGDFFRPPNPPAFIAFDDGGKFALHNYQPNSTAPAFNRLNLCLFEAVYGYNIQQ
jgi:hypothetical protein